MKINLWQSAALAKAMEAHDRGSDDEDLTSVYADVENVTAPDGEQLLIARWEDEGILVLFGDGQDVTDEYKDELR